MKPQLKMTQKRHGMFLLTLLMVTLIVAPNAFGAAGDTNAGATISNQATINYQVGGANQTGVLSDNDGNDANGINATSFLVDHKVKPLVAWAGDATVVPNGTGQILTYTLTNDGNTDNSAATPDTLDILLDFEASGTDDFDMLVDTIQIWMENDLQAGLQTSGGNQDQLVTDYVPPVNSIGYVSLERDDPKTIYLVADTPSTPTNSQTAQYWLVATAWDGGAGLALAEDGDGDNAGESEVVWADDFSLLPSVDAGIGASAPISTVPDGKHAAVATYTVSATTLDVTKTSSVVSDPFNTAAPYYRVPGARVRYEIVVNNTGPVAAANLQVVDMIPAGTDYINGSVTATAGVASIDYSNTPRTTPPTAPTWGYVPTWDADGVDAALTWIRINLTNSVAGTVPGPAGSATTQFDVFIR